MVTVTRDYAGRAVVNATCDRCRHRELYPMPRLQSTYVQDHIVDALLTVAHPYTCEICLKAVLHA